MPQEEANDRGASAETPRPARAAKAYRWLQVLATGLVLAIIPMGLYWFVHHQETKTFLERRNARALGSLARHVTAQLNNVQAILGKSPCGCPTQECTVAPRTSEADASDVLDECPSLKSRVEKALSLTPALQFEAAYETASPAERSLVVTDGPKGALLQFEVTKAPHCVPTRASGKSETADVLECDHTRVKITAHAELAELLGELSTSEDIFDDILIVDKNDRVLLQQSRRTSSIAHASQLKVQNGTRETELGGTRWRVYREPIQLTWLAGDTRITWNMVGLVDANRFSMQSVRISLGYVFALGFVLLLGLFGWPVLKVWLLGPRERLKAIDIHVLSLSSLMMVGTVTSFALALDTHVRQKSQLRGTLATVGAQIGQQLEEELEGLALLAFEYGPDTRGEVVASVLTHADDLCKTTGPGPSHTRHCPFFQSILGMDAQGNQTGKWSSAPAATPLASYQDREYFRRAYRLFKAGRDCRTQARADCDYVATPILSRVTGERITAVGVPAPPPRKPEAQSPKNSDAVYLATSKLYSVSQPVLPLDFGFVVIDDTGEVKYHSEEFRSLQEDFFAETAQSGKLRSAAYAGRPDFIELTYHGVDRYAHITPLQIPGENWSLVVFQDAALLETLSANTLLLSLGTLLLLGALYALILVVHSICRRGRGRWLWPSEERTTRYFVASAVLLAVLASFWFGYQRLTSPLHVLKLTCSLSVLAIAATYSLLEVRADRGWWWCSVATLPLVCGVYCLSFLAFSVLVSVLLVGAVLLVYGWILPWRALATRLMAVLRRTDYRQRRRPSDFLHRHFTPKWQRLRSEAVRLVPSLSPPEGHDEPGGVKVVVGYHTTLVLLLLTLGAAPAATLFLDARQGELEAVARLAELDLARQLSARHERVLGEYDNIETADSEAKRRLLHARLAIDWSSTTAAGRDATTSAGPGVYVASAMVSNLYQAPLWPPPKASKNPTTTQLSSATTKVQQRVPPRYIEALSAAEHDRTSDFRLAQFIKDSLPVYNDASGRLRGGRVTPRQSPRLDNEPEASQPRRGALERTNARWFWAETGAEETGDEILFAYRAPRTAQDRHSYYIMSATPERLLAPATGYLNAARVVALGLFLATLVGLVRIVGRLVFGLGRSKFRNFWRNDSSQAFVIHFKPAPERIDELCRRHGVKAVDMREHRHAVSELVSFLEGPRETGILLNNFDACLDTAARRTRVLELLEQGVYGLDEKSPVHLVSSADPLYFVSELDAGEWPSPRQKTHEVTRWARLFSACERVHYDPPKAPLGPDGGDWVTRYLNQECGWDYELHRVARALSGRVEAMSVPRPGESKPAEEVTAHDLEAQVATRCGPRHQVLWNLCTTREKLLLVHLAQERFVNPKNWTVARRLQRRGLLRRDPSYRIASTSFERFIATIVDTSDVRAWESHRSNRWRSISLPLGALLLLVLLFLGMTNPGFVESHVGLITSIAAGVAGLTRLAEAYRRGRDTISH